MNIQRVSLLNYDVSLRSGPGDESNTGNEAVKQMPAGLSGDGALKRPTSSRDASVTVRDVA